jgi:hypothetical protein
MTSRKLASPAGSASTISEPVGLQARTAALADAEACYWATVDEPAASEADRIEAAENLESTRNRIAELTLTDAEAELAEAGGARDPRWPARLSLNDIEPEAEMFW